MTGFMVQLAELGLIPDRLLRAGMRRLGTDRMSPPGGRETILA